MATLADIMFESLTVLGKYGTAKMVVGSDSDIVLYAQTSDVLGEDGYFPCYDGEVDAQEVQRVASLVRGSGYHLRYRADYYDSYSGVEFAAFVLSPF